jgi:hypothetical protein
VGFLGQLKEAGFLRSSLRLTLIGLRPFPFSLLAGFFLRYAPDRFRLTIPISFCNIEVPASLCSDA